MDFSAVDRVNALAAAYGVDVLGVVTTTPWYIAACPGGATDHLDRCAPALRYRARWRRMVARLARRALERAVLGARQRARHRLRLRGAALRLRVAGPALAAEGIRAARPDATIVIGGFARVDGTYIKAALRDKKRPLIGRVDVANIHLRGTVPGVRAAFKRTQAIYRRAGLRGTAVGDRDRLPVAARASDAARLSGRAARPGPLATARAARQVDLGAGAVFVTLRDNHEFPAASPFSSEGIVSWPGARPKPAFRAVQRLAATARSR